MARRKKKPIGKGKIVTIWLDAEHMKLWNDLRNKSAFVQLCLENAAAIMAWDILRKKNPEKYQDHNPPVEESIDEYNALHPLDPLTEQRLEKEPTEWPKTYPNNQELW